MLETGTDHTDSTRVIDVDLNQQIFDILIYCFQFYLRGPRLCDNLKLTKSRKLMQFLIAV